LNNEEEFVVNQRCIRMLVMATLACLSPPDVICFGKAERIEIPWAHLAEAYSQGTLAHGGAEKNDKGQRDNQTNFAIKPGVALAIPMLAGGMDEAGLNKLQIEIARWDETSWKSIKKKPNLKVVTGQILIPNGMEQDGYYRIQLAHGISEGKERLPAVCSFSFLIAKSWKRSILTYCRENRESIELNPDPQLIRSSMAGAHWDHLMEEISESEGLSGDLLATLARAIQSLRDFIGGDYPDLVIGLNKLRLQRFPGAPIEEFVVKIPEKYEDMHKWPVFVHTDIERWGQKDNYPQQTDPMIDIWWHTVTDKDTNWKSYAAIKGMLEEKLNIDDDRIYVGGECRNGLAAMSLAMNYPDHWAECSASLTSNYRYMAGNALNLPIIFVKGEHEEADAMAYYDFGLKCFQYNGCRYLQHSTSKSIEQVRGSALPCAVRKGQPQNISFTIESYSNPKAYWAEVLGRDDDNLVGTIEASISNQTVHIKTTNINAYKLDFSKAPVNTNRPIEIIENNSSLGTVLDNSFTRISNALTNSKYTKNKIIHGPIFDAFSDPYIVVYGTDGLDQMSIRLIQNAANELSRGAPCVAERDIPSDCMKSHNLILVGLRESNGLINELSRHLPVRTEKGIILTSNNKKFDYDDMGYSLVHPNPNNPTKYVVVNQAMSSRALAGMVSLHEKKWNMTSADVAIYQVADTDDVKWFVREKLNSVWDWHKDYDHIVGDITKKHPRWQWGQWIACVVREYMDSDVVIYEENLRDSEFLGPGEKTFRDFFNAIQNDWLIKVRMKGLTLRHLLMSPIETKRKREAKFPIIDGITLSRTVKARGDRVLLLKEVDLDELYDVVLSEKCLNGDRMGIVINDYEIVQQRFLMTVLKEYFRENNNIRLSESLNQCDMNIF